MWSSYILNCFDKIASACAADTSTQPLKPLLEKSVTQVREVQGIMQIRDLARGNRIKPLLLAIK